jgi:hypothetical protein
VVVAAAVVADAAVVVVRATVVVDATVVGAAVVVLTTVVVGATVVVVRATVVVVCVEVVVVVGRDRWRSIETGAAETCDSMKRNALVAPGDAIERTSTADCPTDHEPEVAGENGDLMGGLLLLAANANVLSWEAAATRLMTQTTVMLVTFFFLDMTLPQEPMPAEGLVRKTYRRDVWRDEVSPAQVHVWRPAWVLSPALVRSARCKPGVYERQIKRSPTLPTPDRGRRLRSAGRGQAGCEPVGIVTTAGTEHPAFQPSGNAACPSAGDRRSRP